MNDTSPEMQAVYDKMLAARTVEERLNMIGSMYEFAKQLAIAGILNRSPDISPAELRAEVFRRFYRDDFSPDELERIIAYLNRKAE